MAAETTIDRMYDRYFSKTRDPVAAATLTLAQVQAGGESLGRATNWDVLNSPDVPERLQRAVLTPPRIAKMIGVTPETVICWIRSGQLKASNIARGRRPRYVVVPAD